MDPQYAGDLLVPADTVYLATAAESLWLRSHQDALQRYGAHKAWGSAGHATMHETVARCRRAVSQLLEPQLRPEIGFSASSSQALSAFVHALRWEGGENVVVGELDFISNHTAVLPLRRRGIEVRVVGRQGGEVPLDLYRKAVDARTRLVIVSLVSHWSGYKHDLDGLWEICRRHGALLAVDATQALGVTPVPIDRCHFLTASVYKWLLGMPGLAIVYVRPDILPDLDPSVIGWQGLESWDIRDSVYQLRADSRLFEMGFPNFAGLYVLENGVRYLLSLQLERVQQKTGQLVSALMEGLTGLGLDVLTPSDPGFRAGIVSIRHHQPQRFAELLAELGVYVSAGEGRVRFAPYFYNSHADIARAVESAALVMRKLAG